MKLSIKQAAVIGSGIMGSGIAALLANVGVKVYLFDIVPNQLTDDEQKQGLSKESKAFRNRMAEQAKENLLKQKPAPLYRQEKLEWIETCNLEDDLPKLAEVDWIIEAVVEKLEIKQAIYEKIEPYYADGTIISTNTSGLSVEKMIKNRKASMASHFLGTHFFNPPRYLKLLELIPTSQTKPEILHYLQKFAQDQLGKGVVICKDTPNFIANRIGTYGIMVTLHHMFEDGYTVSEIDAVTGPALGRPKSASLRMLDVIGLDTIAHVTHNVYESLTDKEEREVFHLPQQVQKMLEENKLGEKTGLGFYKKIKGEKGSEILELDFNSFQYVPLKKVKAASLEQSKRQKGLNNRLKSLLYAEDRAAKLAWSLTKSILLYSAEKLGEIADDIISIDRAIKWGFGWELGPFELWDAIGVEQSVQRMKKEGEKIPNWVEQMLQQGKSQFYQQEKGTTYYISNVEEEPSLETDSEGERKQEEKESPFAYLEVENSDKEISLSALKEQGKLIKKNTGASLIDIGDGIACLEFHSPQNAIGGDILQMIHRSIDEVNRNYEGLVIGHYGKHFCVGANIMLLLMEAQEGNWEEIDLIIRQFQQAMARIRYSPKPVVVAPFSMTLGGGTELCLPAARIQAAAETYMGLVEVGVGLIPAGGGTKELLLRLQQSIPSGIKIDAQEIVNFAFETIAMAKVSTSAEDAKQYSYIRPQDGISINQSYLLYDAKQVALSLAKSGYTAPLPQQLKVVGEAGKAVLKLGAYAFKAGGQISEHDYKIAEKLAHVLSGGNLAAGSSVSEEVMLDLEREAFLSLVGEPKTQARMQHMLLTGKPLRN